MTKITVTQLNERVTELRSVVQELVETVRGKGMTVGIAQELKTMKDATQAIKEDIDRNTEDIQGDGNGKPGLRAEIRELKWQLSVGKWLLLALAGLVLTMLGEAVKRWLFGDRW